MVKSFDRQEVYLMYKAVVSDLDGTLLNGSHEIDEFTKETVSAVIDKGIKFYIATGRSYSGAKAIMDKLGLKIPLITSNGARIMDEEGKEIYINNLEKKYSDSILDIDYKKKGESIVLNVYSGNDWYVTEDRREFYMKINPKRTFFPEVTTLEDLKTKEFTKIFFLGEHDELLELEKEIEEVTKGEVNIAFVLEHCLEIFSKESDKANAAKFLLKRDGIDIKDAVSFGDGENDYEMLTMAGKGFIMGNALYKLKNMMPEDFEIIGTNNEDGEAKKLVEIF